MTLPQSLAQRIRDVYLNGKWIANTNYIDQLMQIHWQQALTRFNNLNSIAMLAYHVNYYLKGLSEAFVTGELLIRDKNSYDLPEIESENDWQNLINELKVNAEKFAGLVELIPEERLIQKFIDEKYGSWLRNIEGVIEHSYYHLGQISLLRKLSS
ncbi:MAG: DUF1572 domain-containing protein [Bacteroidetes bacterium]|nr:DUF1572 domain-containing protein [Bacteroidota bacterium]